MLRRVAVSTTQKMIRKCHTNKPIENKKEWMEVKSSIAMFITISGAGIGGAQGIYYSFENSRKNRGQLNTFMDSSFGIMFGTLTWGLGTAPIALLSFLHPGLSFAAIGALASTIAYSSFQG